MRTATHLSCGVLSGMHASVGITIEPIVAVAINAHRMDIESLFSVL